MAAPIIANIKHNNIPGGFREGGDGGMIASYTATFRVEAGDRVIIPLHNLRITNGVALQFNYDRAANGDFQLPAAGAQTMVFQTICASPPHSKLHFVPEGWPGFVKEALAAGEEALWEEKFPDTGGVISDATMQAFYRGHRGGFRIYSRSGSHQYENGANAKVPVGEAYQDWPLAALMVAGLATGLSGTAHFFAQ